MCQKILAFFFVVTFITACDTKEKSNHTAVEKKKLPLLHNCYKYAGKNDTITLKIINGGDSITGSLIYKLKEKDTNKGTIVGVMKGDILIADYTFMSEGILSVRQVVLKQEGNGFIEGYGKIVTGNKRSFYKNIDSLYFNNVIKLIENPCE